MSGDDSPNTASDLTVVKDLFGLVLEAEQASAGAGAGGESVVNEAQAALAAADPVVRSAVDRLLAAHRRAAGVLLEDKPGTQGRPSGDLGETASGFARPQIGGYEIGEEIGRGGFGVVYRALQVQPVQRPVAVKILRTELASSNIISRFRAESRLLAKMSHPGIAHVLDAGLDSFRRPFVTMELLDGKPLVDYCEAHHLSVRERVQLLIDVCEAVHHAHQRAVIHRDLKPANILVEHVDGRHRPRVIDFGIAKLIEADDEEHRTQDGAKLGTPRYMSPEQAAGSDTADVRTDVYALGVLLCEALTNQVPREPAGSSDSGSKPRSRASRPSQLASGGDSAMALRSRELKGDLDRIVLKAVALEPDERYDSAAALAEDLKRYLDGRPVLATPPGVVYFTRKFVARHKTVSAAIVLAALSLVGGMAAAMYGQTRANESRAEAELALKDAEQARARSERVTEFVLNGVLDALNPDLTGESDRSLSRLFGTLGDEASQRLADDPLLLIDVYSRIGSSLRTVTDFQAAAGAFRKAAALSAAHYGASDRRTLNLRMDALIARMSARELDGIDEEIAAILDLAQMHYGEHDSVTLRANVHFAHIVEGTAGIPRMRNVVQAIEQSNSHGSDIHLEAIQFLGTAMLLAEDPEASTFLLQAADLAASLRGASHSATIEMQLTAARALAAVEDPRAEQILSSVIDTSDQLYGEHSVYAYVAMGELAALMYRGGRLDEAMEIAQRRKAGAIWRKGESSLEYATAVQNIGLMQRRKGEVEQALVLMREAHEVRMRVVGEDHFATYFGRLRLAETLMMLGQAEEAIDIASPVLDGVVAGHYVRVNTAVILAQAMEQVRGHEAAMEVISRERALLPEGHAGHAALDAWQQYIPE